MGAVGVDPTISRLTVGCFAKLVSPPSSALSLSQPRWPNTLGLTFCYPQHLHNVD